MAAGSTQSILARAETALERGLGSEASQLLTPVLRAGALSREDELSVRTALAEAWLLQDDLTRAASVLGRTPDSIRDPISDARLSTLWRLHGCVAFARGEQSRAIALHTRALKRAERSHDSRAIGLAHHELARCYKQVGDSGIVRDHLTEAASALHAAGDRRHLALVHSLSAVLLAQAGRSNEATAALRQGERLAQAVQANDVLAGIVHNQANVALMRHHHDDALALAERSVALHEALGSGRGLAVALATLGQILVQLGDLDRGEQVLTRTLDVRSSVQFEETTGAVFDTLAQIHLMRGSYERASDYLRQAGDAYGAYGAQTMRWYEWSLKVLSVKLAIRRGAYDDAVAEAEALVQAAGVPPAEALQAELAACEALVAADRIGEAERRLESCESQLDPRGAPGSWAEFLRIRGAVNESAGRFAAAHHDFAQSASVFDLLGERYHAALSNVALGRISAKSGRSQAAQRYLDQAGSIFGLLSAERDLNEVAAVRALVADGPRIETADQPAEADEAVVRRLVDAAILPDLLAREVSATLLDTLDIDAAVVYSAPPGGEERLIAHAGCDAEVGRALIRAVTQGGEYNGGLMLSEPLGQDYDGPRACAVVTTRRPTEAAVHRFRMFTAVARQGFDLCGVRERPPQVIEPAAERPLDLLLPGFICASVAMSRVVEQIQRLRGQNLTVLITGESGTGKDLVARAIHSGSPRRHAMFLPYNCTTTTRELADSQLFGHRRGSFTGAVTDQAGLFRSAAGGTLFLDEIGDLPLDIQPKLLRFLEQGEVMPVGETRPQSVDVRVLAATNADLEQRVAEGSFREDLYYRLCVIRIMVPPLRERREEIPHLCTFFLREACDEFAKPDVRLAPATLDLLTRFWWPGNVRQLRNEVRRAVAMSAPGAEVEPDHLSADLTTPATDSSETVMADAHRWSRPQNLASAVGHVERELIGTTLNHTSGNISEAARVLGLTRRGLYLKMRRLKLEGVTQDI